MYKINYKKSKRGWKGSIDSLIIDGKDLDMMRYSLDMTLMRLHGTYLKEPCESLIIMNNTRENKKEIRSILKARWLFNEETLTEELADLRIETINKYLEKLNEKLLDSNTQGLEVMFIKFEINLYQYAKESLENYLNSNKEENIKKRIKE